MATPQSWEKVCNTRARLQKCWEIDLDWLLLPDCIKEVSIDVKGKLMFRIYTCKSETLFNGLGLLSSCRCSKSASHCSFWKLHPSWQFYVVTSSCGSSWHRLGRTISSLDDDSYAYRKWKVNVLQAHL